MRQAFDQVEIKQQLSKFINLLQTDFKKNAHETPPENRNGLDYPLQKKLSIIYSASEPQSSSLDKQNSNPSANRSFQTGQKPSEANICQKLISSILDTSLTPTQLKLIEKLKMAVQQMRHEVERLGNQLVQVKTELSSEKNANDEMLNVLMKLDQQQKELWNNYNIMSGKYDDVTEKNRMMQGEFEKIKESMIALQNDNDFMKKLIYHANENYQALERKCNQLQNQRQKGQIYTDRRDIKKSSTDHLIKSAKTKKNGRSPSHSQLMRTPSPQNFQDIYRKMIIRTLKFKGKNH